MPTPQPKPKKKKLFGARFTSTLSVALVLFVLGLGALGGLAAAGLAAMMREQFTITIMLDESADEQYAASLVKRLNAAPFVAHTVYISPDSASQIVARDLGERPEEFLGYNPMQASVEFRLKAAYAVRDSIAPLVESIRKEGGKRIESIEYKEDLLDAVNVGIHHSAIFLGILALVLLLISMSLVANTVHLALHGDRFLIGTMRLVGATPWFIRRPFVISQALHGLVAAIVAMAAIAGLLFLAFDSEGSAITALQQLVLSSWHVAAVVVGLLVVGMTLPALAAWRACSKYLHCTTDELYLM